MFFVCSFAASKGVSFPLKKRSGVSTEERIKATIDRYTRIASNNGKPSTPMHEFENLQYYVEVELGSPAQKFNVGIDSTSANLWIPSAKCRSMACWVHNRYKSKDSKTYIADGTPININFDKTDNEGFLSNDFLKIGDLGTTVKFAEMTKINSKNYMSSKIDGILGIGYQDPSETGIAPPVRLFADRNIIDQNIVGLKFGKNPSSTGEFMLGGVNQSLFEQDIYWHRAENGNIRSTGEWYIDIKNLIVKDKSTERLDALVDTTSPLILVPKKVMDTLFKDVYVERNCQNTDKNPQIEFRFQGPTQTYYFYMDPESYVVRSNESGEEVCTLGIAGVEGLEDVILGEPFLRKFYTGYKVIDDKRFEFGIAYAK